MTSPSPSSYVFYEQRNSLQKREENTKLIRVFVTDKKVTIYSKRMVRAAKSGVLFEKIVAQQTVSLHENRHGVKYLKVFTKSLGGSITDISLKSLRNKFFESLQVQLLAKPLISEECRLLVEKTILSWFGTGFWLTNLEDVKHKLLFPALKDSSFPRTTLLLAMLSELQSDYHTVTKALRENNSWMSFIMDVCKNTVKTMDDAVIVHSYPEELLPIALMNLGENLSDLYDRERDALLALRRRFLSLDLKFLDFMFKNLSSESRADALMTLFALVREYVSRQSLRNSSQFHYVNDNLNLDRIPRELRPNLAEEFLKSLKETHSEVVNTERTMSVQIQTELSNVFRVWFAQLVLEPSLKTQLTVKEVESRFMELFNVPLKNNSTPVKFIKNKGSVVCILSHASSKGKSEQYHSDVFVSLKALVRKLPKEKGTGAGYHYMNGYVMEDGHFVLSSGEFYSLDDIMQMIEQGAAVVDEQLTKMGRKITPENRLSFLTLGSKERKFKNTWKFYDWGVTNPERILVLKKAKVFAKRDVQTYNELPDEMFYELLSLEAGTTLNPKGEEQSLWGYV
jgi:hypothetical protein